MATIDTIANNYDSDQDEEYAPAGGASSDSSDSEAEGEVDEDEGSSSKKKRGKKRKASAKAAPLTLKKRALDFSKSRKKKKEDQIGAAVLSDEEEEEEEEQQQTKTKQEHVQEEDQEEQQEQTEQTHEEAQQSDNTSETPTSTTTSSSSNAAEAKPTDSSTSTSTPATSSSSASTSSSSTSTSTAPSKATSLAALMAQINKKPSGTAKAPVKKTNPWDKPKPASKLESLMSTVPDITKPTTTTSKDIDERMKETHTTIKEVATFAGSQIHITRTIEKGSEEEAKHKAAKASRSNLDSILDAIKGKRELTTVDKSKLDWQVSKEKEGDAHELQQFTKNGYVSHMAFLKRAETREAEILRTRRAGGDRAERKAQLNMSELDD